MRDWALIALFAALAAGPSRCESSKPSAPDAGPKANSGSSAGTGASDGTTKGGDKCGESRCHSGELCCDASCGLCAPVVQGCSKQRCPAPPKPDAGIPAGIRGQCGGFAGKSCPGLGRCEDDPTDSCDPKHGGADCGGVCLCDAKAKCHAGQTWNASPGVCSCQDSDPAGEDAGTASAETCGKVVCPSGQQCCNPSCGLCTAPGQGCTKQLCVDSPPRDKVFCGGIAAFQCPGAGECVDDPSDGCDPAHGGADCGGMCVCNKGPAPCPSNANWTASPKVCGCEAKAAGTGPSCGAKTCAAGEVCCNRSCGTCTPPNGACTQQLCN